MSVRVVCAILRKSNYKIYRINMLFERRILLIATIIFTGNASIFPSIGLGASYEGPTMNG